jgi:hypothetical protein
VRDLLRRQKWFGMPRWVALGLAGGLVLVLVAFLQRPQEKVLSAQASTIVEGLRESSVYVAPGAPGLVDAERARQVLGDRPIVVALLDTRVLPKPAPLRTGAGELCKEVAGEVATTIVILFAMDDKGSYRPNFCTGPQFSNPVNPVKAKNFDFPLIAVAELGYQFRATDRDKTPIVEEYVLAFDAQAALDYPESVPRRAIVQPPPPRPTELQAWQIALALAGTVAGTVALFFLLHLLLRLARQGVDRASGRDRRRREQSAQLSELGDQVLHPPAATTADQAEHQAEVARKYVLALRAFEAGRDARGRIAELEKLVRR